MSINLDLNLPPKTSIEEIECTVPDMFEITEEHSIENVDEFADDDVIVLDSQEKLTKEEEEIAQKKVETELFGTTLLTSEQLEVQMNRTKDIQFIGKMSKEELDKAFPIKYQTDKVTTKRNLINKMFCNDDFEENLKNATDISYEEYKKMQRKCARYYSAEIKNGFYQGWIAHCRCIQCDDVLGSFPCSYKKVFWVNAKSCPLCTGKYERMDMKQCDDLRISANKWKKSCRDRNKDLGHIFEHWIVK